MKLHYIIIPKTLTPGVEVENGMQALGIVVGISTSRGHNFHINHFVLGIVWDITWKGLVTCIGILEPAKLLQIEKGRWPIFRWLLFERDT